MRDSYAILTQADLPLNYVILNRDQNLLGFDPSAPLLVMRICLVTASGILMHRDLEVLSDHGCDGGFTDLIQAMVLSVSPKGGIGPTTNSDPFLLYPCFWDSTVPSTISRKSVSSSLP